MIHHAGDFSICVQENRFTNNLSEVEAWEVPLRSGRQATLACRCSKENRTRFLNNNRVRGGSVEESGSVGGLMKVL